MSNLDNLINKILNDCKEEARKVSEAAKAEADGVVARAKAEAELEKARILEGASAEAGRAAERITLAKKLELRDQDLAAKREAVDAVFSAALNKLNALDGKDYWRFVQTALLGLAYKDGELLLPDKFRSGLDELNTFLQKNNKPILNPYKGDRRVNGGFVLFTGGVEYNRSFESLLQYSRYELEGEIVQCLF